LKKFDYFLFQKYNLCAEIRDFDISLNIAVFSKKPQPRGSNRNRTGFQFPNRNCGCGAVSAPENRNC